MEQRTAEKTDMMAHEVAVNKTEMMVQVNEILGKIKNTYFTLFPVTDTIDKWDLIKLNVALPILLVYHAIVIGVFIGSFYTQYTSAVSKTFLSPTTTSPGQFCTTSKNILNLNYRVDRNGYIVLLTFSKIIY